MTVFNLYDDEGKLTQSNKLYDPTGYADRLNELSLKHVPSNHARPLQLDRWHVKNGELTQRGVMPIVISRTVIKAGDRDFAVLSGVPKGAMITITCGRFMIMNRQSVPPGQIEISIPVPCTYHVTVECMPFRPFVATITAIA